MRVKSGLHCFRDHLIGLARGSRNLNQSEWAKMRHSVVNEAFNRDVQDILIAVVNGLQGFAEAINTALSSPRFSPASCILLVIRGATAVERVALAHRRDWQHAISKRLRAVFTCAV